MSTTITRPARAAPTAMGTILFCFESSVHEVATGIHTGGFHEKFH